MNALASTVFPVLAVILGSILAAWRQPGEKLISGLQHLAAGVVFAAAAAEILPKVVHQASPMATLIGGGLAILVMLALKASQGEEKGPRALLVAIALDIWIDGLVLGLAFLAGAKAGFLLTVALTLEVLFLGLTLTAELGVFYRSRRRVVGTVSGLALLLPLGAVMATPVTALPPTVVAGFLSFGLIALLYLVTEELLAEAHEQPDTPAIASMFFVGFLALLALEELAG